MADDTAWMDALPSVAPTPGMVASGMAKASKAQPDAIPTMRIKPSAHDEDTSWMDALPSVAPTGGMLLAQGKQSPGKPEGAGIASNFAAGANKQIFGALGGPVDLMTGALNLIPRGFNAIAGTNIPTIQNPVGGSQWLGEQFGKVSTDPNTVQPTSEAERIAQGVGGGVASVPSLALGGAAAAGRMSGVPGSVANALRSSGGASGPSAALTAGAAGVGAGVGQGAADASPEWAKPYADLAGNLAGAGAVAGVARGAQAGTNLVVRKAGEAGIGGKADLNGVRATQAQQSAVGGKLAATIGPEGRQLVERTLDKETQARGLEETIADPQSTPDERTTAQAQLKDIQGARVNLVPNSDPTTAQVAQSPGATDLENAMRVHNGPAFSERAQQQNNARVGAIQGLEPNQGEPASVGQFFAQHLRQLDAAGEAAIQGQTANVHGMTETVGGRAPTAQYGGQLREMLTNVEAPEHAAASAAFKAIDPDGTWAIASAPFRGMAKRLADEVSPTAQTDGQTNALLARAQSLPGVINFSTLSQIRADINDASRRLMRTGTAPSEVRRLTILKDGIDQTIAQSIDDRAKTDPTLVDRLNVATGRETGAVSGGGVTRASPGGSPSPGAPLGEDSANGRRPSDAAGAIAVAHPQGTDAAPPLIPNVGAEEAGKYYSAVQGWKALKEKFEKGGVGAVLKENDQGFKIPEGNVPAKIFTGGATEPGEVERFINAVGGADKAAAIGRNVLANDLRTRSIIKSDGTLDANKLAAWRTARAPTLAKFPGLDHEFGSIEAAQRTLDQVTAAHKEAVADFNRSAAAQFIHADPSVAVRRALASPSPTETFTQLAQAVRGNQPATDGLKRAVVDYIIERHSSAVPSTDGIDMLKAAGFRSWVDKNKGPLRALFDPPSGNLPSGIQTLEMIAADLRRQAQGPQAVAGSQTATHGQRAARLAVGAVSHGVPLTVLTLLGERLGEHFEHGIVGAIAVPALGMAAHAMRQAGIRTMTDLTREAMLHPHLARVLMERADAAKAISTMTQRRIAAALQGAIMADMTTGERRQ